MIKAVDHITINIKDLEKTLFFYKEILDLESLPMIKMKDQEIYYFKLPGTTKLELINYFYDTGKRDSDDKAKGCCRHFAFEVDDIMALEIKLLNAGYKFHQQIEYINELGFTCGLVYDPNGFELEIIQR